MSSGALSLAIDLLVATGYCFASTTCGHAALRVWGTSLPSCGALPRLLTAFMLGLCLLALAWLALALAGWLSPFAIVGVLVAASLPGLGAARRNAAESFSAVIERGGWWRTQDAGFRFVTSFATVLAALFAIGALVKPPIGDAEAFYMTYATIIADSGRLVPMPGVYAAFSQIGLFGELHFAALMQLAGVAAAKFLLWPVAASGALLLVGIGVAAGLQSRGAWYAVIIVLTSTTFTHYITDGKTELFAASLGLAACFWALMCRPGPGGHAGLALAGLFAGFASVSKLSYLAAFLPPLFLLVAWRHWLAQPGGTPAAQRLSDVVTALVQLAFWSGCAWIPNMAKNALLFAAPLAPFLGGASEGIIDQTWFSADVTRRILATYPFALVFGRYPMQGGNLSFLLLAFLPLALFLPRARPLLRSTLAQLAVAAMIGTAIWVLARPSLIAPRYLLATLLLFVPLAAHAAEAAESLESRPGWLRRGLLVTMIIALAIFTYPHRKLPWEFLKQVLGRASPCQLASPYCEPLTAINRRATAGDRVFFAAYYGFWLRPDLLQCRDNGPEQKLVISAPGSPWPELAEQGFRFVVVDPVSHGSVLNRLQGSESPAWLAVSVLHEDAHLVVYELTVGDQAYQPATRCLRSASPAWEVAPR